MFYKVFVNYQDKIYTNGLDPLVSSLIGFYDTKKINVEEGKSKYQIYRVCHLEETDEELKLLVNKLFFNIDSLSFEEEEASSYSFNKITCEGNIENPLDLDEVICESSVEIFVDYICKVAKLNNNVYSFINGHTEVARGFMRHKELTLGPAELNLLKFVTNNLIELEKLITSGNEMYLLDLLKTENAKLEKGKKLSQVISLPKFALDYINENELLGAKVSMQNIANDFDGNTLKIIIDMFNAFVPYEKYDSKRTYYWDRPTTKKITFFENIYELLKRKYKIVDLLNYLLKQRMYWSDEEFGFPYEETKTLLDYVTICEKYKLRCEKYPQNLTKYHDIVVKNVKILDSDKEKKESFENAVSSYFTSDITIGDYVFKAPSSIAELVFEGDELHHCIGNYSDSIINGISRIYFMRKQTEENKPFVTIELNNSNDLVEYKGDYNKEPTDDEVIKAIKDFVKKVKKTGGK